MSLGCVFRCRWARDRPLALAAGTVVASRRLCLVWVIEDWYPVGVGVEVGLRIRTIDVVAVGCSGILLVMGSHASLDGSIQYIQSAAGGNPRRDLSILFLPVDQGNTLGHGDNSDVHRVGELGRDGRGDSLDSTGGDQFGLRLGDGDPNGILDSSGGSLASLLHRVYRLRRTEDVLFVHYP